MTNKYFSKKEKQKSQRLVHYKIDDNINSLNSFDSLILLKSSSVFAKSIYFLSSSITFFKNSKDFA